MNFDKKVIAGCLQSEQIFGRVCRLNFKPEDFENELNRYVFKAAMKVAHTDTISEDSLSGYVQTDRDLDDEDKRAVVDYVKELCSEDLSGVNLSLDQLAKKKASKEFVKSTTDAVKRFKNGESVEQIAHTLAADLRHMVATDTGIEVFNYYDDYTTRKVERHEQETGLVKSLKMTQHLRPFSTYFPKGWQAQEVTAIGGPTYAGKSVLMSNCIYVAVHPTNGLNGLYIFAENRKIQAGSRLDAIFLDRNYEALFKNSLTDTRGDKFFEQVREDGWGELFYSKATPNNFTANTVRQSIDIAREQCGGDIHFVAIDSPDHMQPIRPGDSTWENKGRVYWDLKQVADEENVIMLTTLPMKASSTQKKHVTAEETAGAYDIARICDNQIFFNVDPEDRLLNRAKLQVVKNRDGKIDMKIVYLRFENTLRMVPAHEEEFQVSSEEDEKNRTKSYKIKQFDGESKFKESKV